MFVHLLGGFHRLGFTFLDHWIHHVSLETPVDVRLQKAVHLLDAGDRKSTRLNSSHTVISYAVFCLIRIPPLSPLFPYTTLFRSTSSHVAVPPSHSGRPPSRDVRASSGRLSSPGFHFPRSLDTPRKPGNPCRCASAESCTPARRGRSEEHTSELQSHSDLVCRLLLDTYTATISPLSLHDALPIYIFPCSSPTVTFGKTTFERCSCIFWAAFIAWVSLSSITGYTT